MKFKYPKITAVLIIIVLCYIVFSNPSVRAFFMGLNGAAYVGALLGGLLYSYGFTTPIATGIFLDLTPENIFIAAAIGGIGALISDMTIYKIFRISLMDEFVLISKTEPMRWIVKNIKKHTHRPTLNVLTYIIAMIVIASPLPDEIGILMLAGIPSIDTEHLAIASFIANTTGIFILLLL